MTKPLFNFGVPFTCARLHIRRSRQNTFYTITDLQNKVVLPLSLGLLAQSRNKRVKLSPATLERVLLQIKSTLREHSISAVTLLIRSRIPR
jgi:ribosomal protein S11